MKALLKLFIILSASILTARSYAFPELPFCPAGGPPGWLNYFNDKRDQNTWRRYSRHTPDTYSAGRYPSYYAPAYNPTYGHDYMRPYTYTPRY